MNPAAAFVVAIVFKIGFLPFRVRVVVVNLFWELFLSFEVKMEKELIIVVHDIY